MPDGGVVGREDLEDLGPDLAGAHLHQQFPQVEGAEPKWRDWKVFLDRGETTWPGCWNGGTKCHGWSSTPTRDLLVHQAGAGPSGD